MGELEVQKYEPSFPYCLPANFTKERLLQLAYIVVIPIFLSRAKGFLFQPSLAAFMQCAFQTNPRRTL